MDDEPYKGRSDYAKSQVGGYYASRLAVVEALNKMRKQAKVIVFREIGEGYSIPLGVWQVRENVRNAFKQKSMKFTSKQEALEHVSKRIKLQINEYVKRSKILQQRRLGDFL